VSAYADTSFVLSWFIPDANHSRAVSRIAACKGPAGLPWTPWSGVEFNNSLRALVARGLLSPSVPLQVGRQLRSAFRVGDLVAAPLPVYRWWAQAEELSRAHTVRLGVRTLDLLHVAAARVQGADEFLTFDQRQRGLAEAAGLLVGP
jgi:predicted nucleic acid-binding protein